jgi:hypothetical protein
LRLAFLLGGKSASNLLCCDRQDRQINTIELVKATPTARLDVSLILISSDAPARDP